MLRKLSVFILVTISAAAAISVDAQIAGSRVQIERSPLIIASGGSYLGVQMQDVSKENFAKLGLSEVRGVAVEKVVENSPAASAGLEKGDVIIKFNGEEVSGVRKLTRLIAEVAPDHKASVTILRGGNEREISVTLGKREVPNFEMSGLAPGNLAPFPSMPEMPQTPQVFRTPRLPAMPNGEPRTFIWRTGERRQIGIDVTPLTKQLGDYFGVASGKGLLIDSVRADSPAAKAGLKAGDVIVEADGKEVAGNMDLIRIISEQKEGNITLTIVREKNRQTIQITPETVKGENAFPGFQQFENYEQGFAPMNNLKTITPTPQVAPVPPRANLFSPRVL